MNIIILFAILGILLLIIGLIIYLSLTVKQNFDLYQQGTLIPFAASIDPIRMSITDPLMNGATGLPQISCPVGYKVNIVGAFAQPFDPYGECNTYPSSLVASTCDPTAQGSPCTKNRDCGPGYQCRQIALTQHPRKPALRE